MQRGCVTNMRYKIAAMGRPDEVFPFLQIGIDTFAPEGGNALSRQVAGLVKEGYALFFVSQDCLAKNPALLSSYDHHPSVTIVPIPGLVSEQSLGLERIQSMVEKALGQNIL